MDFSSNTLAIELGGHVATLWLDRPQKMNAISHEMWEDFPRAIAAIAADESIRALVIAARGKSFCVGVDLATACDIRLASRDALFGVRETNIGIVADVGTLQRGENLTTEQGLLLNGLWTMVTSLNSNDLKEAMQAFMQKRPPNYTGS